MQLLKPEDAEALREHAEKIGSDLAVATISRVFFAPPPPSPEPEPLARLGLPCVNKNGLFCVSESGASRA